MWQWALGPGYITSCICPHNLWFVDGETLRSHLVQVVAGQAGVASGALGHGQVHRGTRGAVCRHSLRGRADLVLDGHYWWCGWLSCPVPAHTVEVSAGSRAAPGLCIDTAASQFSPHRSDTEGRALLSKSRCAWLSSGMRTEHLGPEAIECVQCVGTIC